MPPKRESVRKILEQICAFGYGRSEVLRGFALLSACALSPRIVKADHPHGSVSMREPEYMAEVGRWKPEALPLFAEAFGQLIDDMEAEPFRDRFGDLHQEWRADIDRKSGGEFYTPYALCKMMSEMSVPKELPSDRPLTILEPAGGVGGMLLASAEVLVDRGVSPLCMRATCIDVDRAACDMAFVNLTLSGIPATVVHGNSLSLETWGSWRNLFWSMARGVGPTAFEILGNLRTLIDLALVQPRPADELPVILGPKGQFAFDWEVAA